MKLELIGVPVSDVDAAKAFYIEKLGFNADFDQVVNENLRFVQLTPPGSACSICIGIGLTKAKPGTLDMLQVVIANARKAHDELAARRRGQRRGRPGLGLICLPQRPRRQQMGAPGATQARVAARGVLRPGHPGANTLMGLLGPACMTGTPRAPLHSS